MTVKKRIQIFNIVVTLMSLLLALLIASVSIYASKKIISNVASSTAEYDRSMEPFREEAVGLLKETLNRTKSVSVLEEYLKENEMWMMLSTSEDEFVAVYGNELRKKHELSGKENELKSQEQVSKRNVTKSEYIEMVTLDGVQYKIAIYSWRSVDNTNRIIQVTSIIICLIAILFSVLLTNRIMVQFLLKHITEPLQVLMNGTNAISEGNLDYRIEYNQEDEFKKVCQDFNGMAAGLQDSMSTIKRSEEGRKELLVGISHDIRSPLTAIKAHVEGLLDGVVSTPEMQKKYLQTINRKTEEINNMVSKLFVFSKMDMDNYPYEPQVINVSEELFQILLLYKEKEGVKLEVKLCPGTHKIYADKVVLRSAITNIMENAIKHNLEQMLTITFTTNVTDDKLLLFISDDGKGVEEEKLEKIFEVFYRTDQSRQNPQNGSGLGLAIVKKAVDMMKGRIYANQTIPHGLTVVIELPLYQEVKHE